MIKQFLLALGLLSAPAIAVNTSYWTQTSEADFKAGTLENVVATNLGELKLSRAVKTLLEQDPRISTVNRLIEAPDGTIYAGTSPGAILLQIKDQKVSDVQQIPDATDILSMAIDSNGALLLGTGGEKGCIYRLEKPGSKARQIATLDGVQYVWALLSSSDGTVYAATGPEGKLFEIHRDGSSKVLLETEENNLLSMISDGKNLLYIGTDPHGLVYRVNRRTGESFVLYNAPESEITALALDKQGNLYAGTGEARTEQTNPAQNAQEGEKGGRPEGGETGVPISPGKPGEQPAPPAPPDPNPGQPDPIPKQPRARADRYRALSASSPVLLASDMRMVAEIGGKHKPHPGPAPGPQPGPGKPQPPLPPQTEPAEQQSQANQGPGRQPQVDVNGTGEPRPEGNAVYKIDINNFVTEIFRQPALVLSMVESNGNLLIGTGSDGEIFQVNPQAEETVMLAKVDAKQVLSLLQARDGNVYMGMANVGSIATLIPGFANKGTYTSTVLDATQISLFGKMQLHGSLPAGTSLMISTRSGNVKDASEKNWSKWSDPVNAIEFFQVPSPSARFLQYRLTLSSKEGKSSPIVEDVSVAYQVPNLPPQIKAVHVTGIPENESGGGPANSAANPTSATAGGGEIRRVEPMHKATITWEASDPNGDVLLYTLYFRRGLSEEWILLKDKLTEQSYEWDTRAVADGRYEIKVVASDANANPLGQGKTASRVSNAITVDNTPPVIGDIKTSQKGGLIHIDLRAQDRTSTVAAVDYSVDSNQDWQLVLPTNKIYDSPEATVALDIPGLSPGAHQITFRATDSQGNQGFANVSFRVEGPAAAR